MCFSLLSLSLPWFSRNVPRNVHSLEFICTGGFARPGGTQKFWHWLWCDLQRSWQKNWPQPGAVGFLIRALQRPRRAGVTTGEGQLKWFAVKQFLCLSWGLDQKSSAVEAALRVPSGPAWSLGCSCCSNETFSLALSKSLVFLPLSLDCGFHPPLPCFWYLSSPNTWFSKGAVCQKTLGDWLV